MYQSKWVYEFEKLPEIVRNRLSLVADRYSKNLGRMVLNTINIAKTHHQISRLPEGEEKWMMAVTYIEQGYETQRQSADVYQQTIQASAESIIRENKIMTSKPDENTPHRLYIWNGKYYREDLKDVELKVMIEDTLGAHSLKRTKEEIIEKIKILTLDTEGKLFRDKKYISLNNNMLNTETMEIESLNPDKFILNHIPVNYNPELGYKDWDNIVMEWVGNKRKKDALQEFTGYNFIDGQWGKKILYIDGPHDSGKSKYCNAVEFMLGDKNCSHLTIQQVGERFDASSLYGKLANIRSDINVRIASNDVSIVKALTGDDTIKVEKKHETAFFMKNRAKITWTGNGAPRISEGVLSDSPFLIRWLPISFPYMFLPKKEYDRRLLEDLDNVDVLKEGMPADELINLLYSENMKSQVFNWALEGIKRLKANKWVFSYNPTDEETKDWFYRRAVHDNALMFLVIKVKKDNNGRIKKSSLYNRYKEWCDEKLIPCKAENAFGRTVKNNGIRPVTEIKLGEDAYWCGISLDGDIKDGDE